MNTNKKLNKQQLNTREETIDSLQSKCIKLEHQVEELSTKVKYYEELFRINQSKKYGSSSEKSSAEQLSFFNEAEKTSRENLEEPTVEEITYKRKKRKGLNKKSFDDLEVEVIEYKLSDEELACPVCRHDLHTMSKEIRKELKIIPAQVKVVHHVQHIYACRNCEKTNISTPVIKVNAPSAVIPRSFVSPSLLAFIMNRKYAEYIPLYRQEQGFVNFGIEISRQNMANWVIKGAKLWLESIYERLHYYLTKESFIHGDETPIQVLNEKDKSATSKCYMWVYTTGRYGKQIALYDYQPSRSAKKPKAFLSKFSGYLQTDGYSAYNKIDNVTNVGCFAHVRRKFDEALKSLSHKSSESGIVTRQGIDYCNRLFKIERKICDKTVKERYDIRLKESKPILEAFLSWLELRQTQVLPKSALGRAINYALRQWQHLESYLKSGECELSNNKAERAVKPFVMGRKNFLFCKTPNGARASAVVYSIIETAKANGLSPYHYLEYLFEKLPNIDLTSIEEIDFLMPWSDSIPDYCKVNKSHN